jgi:hypothetical protein
VRFVELRRARIESAFLVVDTRRPQGDDYMLLTGWTGREYRHQLYRTIPFSDADADRIRCPGISVRWSRRDDVISLAVPQTCLKRPTQHVRLGFYSGGHRAVATGPLGASPSPDRGSAWVPAEHVDRGSAFRRPSTGYVRRRAGGTPAVREVPQRLPSRSGERREPGRAEQRGVGRR